MHHECMLYRMHSCLCKRTRVAGRGLASRRMIYGTARAAAVSLMIYTHTRTLHRVHAQNLLFDQGIAQCVEQNPLYRITERLRLHQALPSRLARGRVCHGTREAALPSPRIAVSRIAALRATYQRNT